MYSTFEPYLNLSLTIDFTNLLNLEIQESTFVFDPLVLPKPSSMYHHRIVSDFFLQNFSSFARYKLARIGATFVPIMMLNNCWKYSPWNSCPIKLYQTCYRNSSSCVQQKSNLEWVSNITQPRLVSLQLKFSEFPEKNSSLSLSVYSQYLKGIFW